MNEEKNLDIDTQDVNMFNEDLETLNTNVWFNKIETRLQYCLTKDDVKGGFLQYKMLVAHAEMIAISSNKMDENEYIKEFNKIKAETDMKGEDVVRQMKEAMIKYKIILKYLLKTKKSDLNISY